MADSSSGRGSLLTDGGISGEHPSPPGYTIFVGPATSDEYNTLRAQRTPTACWRLEDIRFEFDSSFIAPSAAEEFKNLASLIRGLPGAPLSVFGHADPVSNDVYNKELSERRAMAVYGMLTRDTDMWDKLYNKAHGGDDWKKVAVQTILLDLGYSPDAPGTDKGAKTSEALKNFQGDNGLPPTGKEDKATRAKLFLVYMDKHCKDESGNPFKVEKKDFLAQGADKDGKGDYQGCSEFNPVLMFSKEEDKEYSKPENKEKRNAENAPNRRVLIFMFRPKSYTIPNLWPCPSVKEGVELCKKRFWSDAKKRREFQENRREYHNTKDTFACRFYDRLGVNSPCENILLTFNTVDLIFQRYPGTEAASAIQGLEYEYTVAGSNPIKGTTGADGKARIRIPPGENAELKIMGTTYQVGVLSTIEPYNKIEGMQKRLNMLGYRFGLCSGKMGPGTEYPVLDFQADNAPLKVDGLPSANTQQAIRDKVGE